MSNLLAQGAFGCVYYPSLSKRKRRKSKSNPREFATKVQRRDAAAKNEINVGERVRSFGKYKLFFLPVIKSWELEINAKDASKYGDCDVITKESTDYIAMDIPYVATVNLLVELRKADARRRSLILLESFRYLLVSVLELQELNVVHFDLKLGNVVYAESTFLPRILDFGISIMSPMSLAFKETRAANRDVLEKLQLHFYAYTVEYTPWCLDIVVLSFIAGARMWDKEAAGFIYQDYTLKAGMNSKRLRLTEVQLKKYGKMQLEDVVNYLLSHWQTWDAYSIGIMYESILGSRHGENTSVFLKSWEAMIEQLTSPNPDMRIPSADARKRFDDLFLRWNDPKTYARIVDDFHERDINLSSPTRPEASVISTEN